jgi:hypothetical protein
MTGSELLVPAGVAFAAAGLIHLWFAHEELYLSWLVPAVLAALPVGYWATTGSPTGVAAFAGLFLGACVFGARSWFLLGQHRARLGDFADELGLRFSVDDQTFAPLASALVDDVGRCFNVLSGTWRGVPAAVFGYRYIDTSDDPAVIELTCAATTVDAELPYFVIRPRGSSIRRVLISREGDAFDRHFEVATTDPERAKAAIPLRVREWLLAHAKNGRLAATGDTIVLSVGRSRMRQIPEVLDGIVDLRVAFRSRSRMSFVRAK